MSTEAPTPIEVKLGDGTVVKADNMEDAFKVVAKMKEDTSAALKAEREQRESLAAEVNALKSAEQTRQAEAERKRKAENSGGFDRDHYYQLLNNDPMDAQDYLDAYRFGIDQGQVRNTFITLNQDVTRLRQEALASAFIAQHHEDFPLGDKNAASALTRRVEELVGNGMPMSLDTMNFAYSQLIESETIKPVEAEAEEKMAPNPSLRGSGATAEDAETAKIAKMNDKELEAWGRQKGFIR